MHLSLGTFPEAQPIPFLTRRVLKVCRHLTALSNTCMYSCVRGRVDIMIYREINNGFSCVLLTDSFSIRYLSFYEQKVDVPRRHTSTFQHNGVLSNLCGRPSYYVFVKTRCSFAKSSVATNSHDTFGIIRLLLSPRCGPSCQRRRWQLGIK